MSFVVGNRQPKLCESGSEYTDPDNSAKDMHRPAFIDMCRDIRDGKINAVIATELARLSRNAKDFLQFWDFLKQKNVKLFVLKENFDTSTLAGEMMLIQMAAFAQFERESIVARVRDGARARAERGLHNGGPRQLGYDPDPTRPCHVVVNEKEKPYVQMIFRKFLELGTIAKLQKYLNKNGYRTKEYVTKEGRRMGGKLWSNGAVHIMLTSVCYVGKREIHRRWRTVDQETLKPEQRYKIVDAHWPALITEKIFSDVQNLLEANKSEARRYVHRYRLKQLVWCGLCNSPMVGKTAVGNGGRYFYYGHMRKMKTVGMRHVERCAVENISAPHLEEAVISRLTYLSKDDELLKSLAASALEEAKTLKEQNRSLVKTEEERFKANQKKIDGLLSSVAFAPSEETKRMTYGKIESLSNENMEIEQSLNALKGQASNNTINMQAVFRLFKTFNKAFPKLPAHEQRDIIREAVKRVTVTEPGKAKIEYYKSAREEIFPGHSKVDLLGDVEASVSSTNCLSLVRTVSEMVEDDGYAFTVLVDLPDQQHIYFEHLRRFKKLAVSSFPTRNKFKQTPPWAELFLRSLLQSRSSNVN